MVRGNTHGADDVGDKNLIWESRLVNASSEQSVSLWMATAEMDSAAALDRDERADAVVVGLGIAGLRTG